MKSLLLSLFIAVSLFAQTVDSVGVNWFDPTDSDLDSMLVMIRKVYNPTDTPIVARINEGIETARFVPPDTGLYFVAPVGKDDSGNVAIPVFTLAARDSGWVDTVTVWQTAGGGAHVTDSLEYYGNIDSLTNNAAVDVWEDEITVVNCLPYDSDSTNRPIRVGNDVWFMADDWLMGGSLAKTFTGDMSIEIVAEFSDSVTTEVITIRGANRLLALSFHGNRFCLTAWDGTNIYNYNVYSDTVMGRHHIVGTWDGVNEAGLILSVDNVVVPTMSNVYGIFAGEAGLHLSGASVSTMDFSMPLWRIYSDALTAGEKTTNYNSTSVQDLIP